MEKSCFTSCCLDAYTKHYTVCSSRFRAKFPSHVYRLWKENIFTLIGFLIHPNSIKFYLLIQLTVNDSRNALYCKLKTNRHQQSSLEIIQRDNIYDYKTRIARIFQPLRAKIVPLRHVQSTAKEKYLTIPRIYIRVARSCVPRRDRQ